MIVFEKSVSSIIEAFSPTCCGSKSCAISNSRLLYIVSDTVSPIVLSQETELTLRDELQFRVQLKQERIRKINVKLEKTLYTLIILVF